MTRMGRAAVAAILLLLLAGCGGDEEAGPGGGSGGGSGSDASPAVGTILTVYQGDTVMRAWTLEELRQAVAFADVDIDGRVQSGPLLVDVLDASGVTAWSSGEVLGKGEGRAFDVGVDIEAANVVEGWVLDVTNRGTLKLAADDLPQDRWVRDVGEIRLDG